MTRRNSIQTIHEPFGDAFYYGPERMGTRFENDEEARLKSGFSQSTFKTIMDRIEKESAEVRLTLFPWPLLFEFPLALRIDPDARFVQFTYPCSASQSSD